ncbi:MAG: DUF3316 domain-containing protein [Prevotellaceae bacterium]|nr:DUF3316 domain-containing protein [Prevotellaceae bacterium]
MLLLIGSGEIAAQEISTDSVTRNITRATLYGIGTANVYDTYLSPQAYKGIDLRILRESSRMTKWWNGNLSRQTLFQVDVGYTHNRVDNNNTFSGLMNWNYGLHYNFPVTPRFRLLTGAVLDLNGGFVYNLRNGNNPASARAYANIDASGMAVWDLRIRNYPITLRYQLNVPLLGAMFSPHYGQSYYEIFVVGNTGGVVQFTALHNNPSLRQLLSADIPLCKATLRLAWMWDAQQSAVNGVRTHTYSHVFMAGVVKKFVLVK